MVKHSSKGNSKKLDNDNWMISSKRDQTQSLEFEISKERKMINLFYFGDKQIENMEFKKPRFVSKHSRKI